MDGWEIKIEQRHVIASFTRTTWARIRIVQWGGSCRRVSSSSVKVNEVGTFRGVFVHKMRSLGYYS